MRKVELSAVKPRVLLTNDDGIEAPGLESLAQAVAAAGWEALVAAPDGERSASSHSMSLRKPLRVMAAGPNRFAVSGTPADTVNIALNHLFRDHPPKLVVSGVNKGANLACDVNYSGTVAAAREGLMLGVPSFAVSLNSHRPEADFGPSCRVALFISRLILEHGLPPRTFLNVNLPDLPSSEIKGLKTTIQGKRRYENVIHVRDDPFGEKYYWVGGQPHGGEPIPDSDIVAVEAGFVSVTPLRLDLTERHALAWLAERLGQGDPQPWT